MTGEHEESFLSHFVRFCHSASKLSMQDVGKTSALLAERVQRMSRERRIKRIQQKYYRRSNHREGGGIGESRFCLVGPLERGTKTRYAIDGQDFYLAPYTWVFGAMRVGAKAKVTGSSSRDGAWTAHRIVITHG